MTNIEALYEQARNIARDTIESMPSADPSDVTLLDTLTEAAFLGLTEGA